MSFFRKSQSTPVDEPRPVEEEDPPAGRLDRRRRLRFGHEGRRILVIDDSAMVVATLGGILHSAGCVVLDAGDAETGLSIAREETPDLIFLDIVLPGMSGFAALRRMRRDPRTQRIPVIIISGTEQAIGRSYAKRIGADDFMKKPFSRRDLFIHIEMLIVEERLPRLDAAPGKRQPGVVDPADVPTTPTPWKNEAVAEDPPNVPITGTPASEARRRLAAMGLQYTSQEQFSTAIKRRDKEIVKLFVIGRGVKVQR